MKKILLVIFLCIITITGCDYANHTSSSNNHTEESSNSNNESSSILSESSIQSSISSSSIEESSKNSSSSSTTSSSSSSTSSSSSSSSTTSSSSSSTSSSSSSSSTTSSSGSSSSSSSSSSSTTSSSSSSSSSSSTGPIERDYLTINEVLLTKDDETVTTRGTIFKVLQSGASTYRGFFIADEHDTLFVYYNKATTLGDLVEVTGVKTHFLDKNNTLNEYLGILEVNATSVTKITGTKHKLDDLVPSDTVESLIETDYTDIRTGDVFNVTGQVKFKSSNYYIVDGSSELQLYTLYANSDVAALSEYVDEFLNFIVVYYECHSTAGKKFYLVSYTIPDLTLEQKFVQVNKDLNIPETIASDTYNFKATSNYGAVIDYISCNPIKIDFLTGSITRPEIGDQDVSVVIKYSITIDSTTIDYTKTILIKAKQEVGSYDGYYDTALGLTGEELKDALYRIIKVCRAYSYSSAGDYLKLTDEDPNNKNNMILFYSGVSVTKGSGVWNKEHVWAKSHGDFGTSTGAGSDIHNLRPTYNTINSTRGNKDFDWGGSPLSGDYGKYGNLTDSDSFEPRNEVKGDVARIIFFMATRYEGGDGCPRDLEVNELVGNNKNPYTGRLSVLLEWHLQDPVDDFERTRNNVIYNIQGNRNPFIDNPQFVNMIWS